MNPLTARILRGVALLFSIGELQAQALHTVTGRVTDAHTHDPVPFASVALKGTPGGGTTNFEGYYSIKAKVLPDSLLVTSVGYDTRTKALDRSAATQTLDIQLQPAVTLLREITVNSGENPAFALLRGVRRHRHLNDRTRLSAYEYEAYSKTELAVSHLSEKFKRRRTVKKIAGVMDRFEKLAGDDGQPVLPVFLSESVSDVYFRAAPQRRKEVVRKTKVTGIGVQDGGFVSQLIGGSFQNFNFYDDYVNILQKDFASPIGQDWKAMYRYFLADSVWIDSLFCYELEFEPKRPQDLAFSGKLWIDKQTHALCRIEAAIGREANLNYIETVRIQQELQPTAGGAWLPAKTRSTFAIAPFSKQAAGMLAKLYVANRNFIVDRPRTLSFYDLPVELADHFNRSDAAYWAAARPDSLSSAEQQALAMIDTVRNLPAVRTYVEVADAVVNGWKTTGPVDVGPYLGLVAFNPVEGLRLRVGMRTNAAFSKQWVVRGFAGYGTRDGRFKYGAELSRFLSRKQWTVVGAGHSQDIERVGITQEAAGNPLFYTFTRFGSRGSFYQTESRVFAKSEPVKGVLLAAALAAQRFVPTGAPHHAFAYRPDPALPEEKEDFRDVRLELELRLARHETYLMHGHERLTVGTKRMPVVSLRYVRGLKGPLGGDFGYHKFSVSAFQTLRLGPAGRSNYRLSAGYTPARLPYPLLFTHLGGGIRNPLYNRFAYNTMDFFEFVSDRYASLQWDHHFDGWPLAHIPGVARLKWRLVASANVLYGGRRAENSGPAAPAGTDALFGSLEPNIPFAEVGYGIDNLFKVLRIQAFHRLTYLDGPHVRPFSLKASVHFHF